MLPLNQERKYNIIGGRIVNRATGIAIPYNEPIMIFRAKDKRAITALRAYLDACTDAQHQKVIAVRIKEFLAFQQDNSSLISEPN